jgi:hypothetical protein
MNANTNLAYCVTKAVAFILVVFVSDVQAQQSSYNYDLSGNMISVTLGSVGPSITTQPQPQLVESNAPVTFSVVATGTGLSFQWLSNGIPIIGATGDSLVLTGMPMVNSTNFSVIVSNVTGVVTSTPAALWADLNGNGIPDWWEMKYFGNLNQKADGDYDGDGVDNLDEYREGTDPTNPNSFNPRLHLTAGSGTVIVSPVQPYYTMGQTVTLMANSSPPLYFLGWSGSSSSATTPLMLTMNGHKQITANWIDANLGVTANGWVNHFNSASDANSWVYWYGVWQDYLGYPYNYAMSWSTMDAQTNSNSGSLYFYSPFGSATSTDQNVIFGPISGTDIPANAISGLSFDIHVTPGTKLSPSGDFGTITVGLMDPTRNAITIFAFSPLTIPAAATNGWVHMVVTNAQDFVNFAQFSSQAAYVGFDYNNNNNNDYPTNNVQMWIDNVAVETRAPTIITQPFSQVAMVGGSASFFTVAQGTAIQAAPLSYSWTLNGTNLSNNSVVQGAATATLTLSNLSLGNAGNYQVTVSNLFGSVSSISAVLSVVPLVTPVVSKVIHNANGSVTLNVLTSTNLSSRIFAATNLSPPILWQPIYTNPAIGTWQFTDTNASLYRTRFYRISTP